MPNKWLQWTPEGGSVSSVSSPPKENPIIRENLLEERKEKKRKDFPLSTAQTDTQPRAQRIERTEKHGLTELTKPFSALAREIEASRRWEASGKDPNWWRQYPGTTLVPIACTCSARPYPHIGHTDERQGRKPTKVPRVEETHSRVQ